MTNKQLCIQQNAALGASLVETALLKKFWVLKRSVDIEGADFLVQQRRDDFERIRNRPIQLGFVQAKFFEGKNQVRIAKSYVETHDGPRPDFFAFLHTKSKSDKTTSYFFSADEIVQSWSVTRCNGYYYFALTKNKQFSVHRNRADADIADMIISGLQQTASHQTEFMVRNFFDTHVDTRTMLPSPHSITYLLRVVEGCNVVFYRDNDNEVTRPLEPRRDLYPYFGDFSWGYSGSGPMFLAASILGHHFGGTCTPTIEQQCKLVKLLEMIHITSSSNITSEGIEAFLRR